MEKYVIYRRLSRESRSGENLGLEAQRSAIERYLKDKEGYQVLDDVVEIETGTRKRKRPRLKYAIDLCRSEDATLIIAKLDRLARNVHVVSGLMESKIKFVALDQKEASPLTIHILAAVAEQEATSISNRVKAALQVKKDQGIKLGPKYKKLTAEVSREARERSNAERKAEAVRFAQKMYPTIAYLKDTKHLSLSQIALELDALGFKTASGKSTKWSKDTVFRCIKRIKSSKNEEKLEIS